MVKEIMHGIGAALYAMFGDEYQVCIDRLEQGFNNPCFFVSLVDWYNDELIMGREKWHTQYNVTYFPENEDAPTDECLEMIPKIKDCLRILELESGDKMRGIDMDAKIVDGIVQFYVTYNFETISENSGTAMASYTERTNNG